MGNELRSPTKIGHLSLSDNSTDDYLYVQGVPIAGGGTPSNMMTIDTFQDVTGAKRFIDNANDEYCAIGSIGVESAQDITDESYSAARLNYEALDILNEITDGTGEITERYETRIAADYVYFSTSSSDSPSPDEESYLRFPLGRDAEILATQNDIKKYYLHTVAAYSTPSAGEQPDFSINKGYYISSSPDALTASQFLDLSASEKAELLSRISGDITSPKRDGMNIYGPQYKEYYGDQVSVRGLILIPQEASMEIDEFFYVIGADDNLSWDEITYPVKEL